MVTAFEDLRVWRYARNLNKSVYLLIRNSGIRKDFGLRDQLQRASVSVMLNIAEGFGAGTSNLFSTYLRYSFRSSCEVKAVMYAALDLEYITKAESEEIILQILTVQKMLSGLMKYLNKS